MQPFASMLCRTMSGEKLVLASGSFLIKSSFSRANTLMNVGVPRRTTLVVARDRPLLQCHSDRGAHFGTKFFVEMAPVIQDTGTAIVIMGVCGAGKSTIGNLLAEAMKCIFLDADDFHPHSNKEKMRKGIPLSDDDRIPWLQTLCNKLKECTAAGSNVILACSALRKPYRDILRSLDPDHDSGNHSGSGKFVLLDVPVDVLADRLNKRAEKREHFMPPSLLQSQLEVLEIDASEGVLQVDATQSPVDIVGAIRDLLSQSGINSIS